MDKTIRCRYSNKLMPNLKALTEGQTADPIVLFSTSKYNGKNFETLYSQIASGLHAYEVAIFSDIRNILKIWDSEHPRSRNRGKFPTISEIVQIKPLAKTIENTVKITTSDKAPDDTLKTLQKKYRNRNQKKRGKLPSKTATLLAATKAGNIEDVKTLIDELGININSQNHEMKTALHAAYEADKPDIIDYLLNSGADDGLSDNDGKTPKEYSQSVVLG